MNVKKYKKEIILIAGILTVSCGLLLFNQFLFSEPAGKVEISVDGNVIQTLNLNEDSDILVHAFNGGTNRIVVKDKKVSVSEASCPDKICVHQGWIQHNGENVVCLPNHMITRIIGE